MEGNGWRRDATMVKRLGQLRGYKVYPLSRTQSTLETIRLSSGCSFGNRPVTQPVQVL